MENITPYESNNINVSGSYFNWLYEILEPYESNVIDIVTGSTAAFTLKDTKIFTPQESNINMSGSVYNWDMGVSTPYEYNVKDNDIKFVNGIDGPANKNRLCVKGRFGFDYVSNSERLTKPLIRIKGKPKDLHPVINYSNIHEYFKEATWEEALNFAANGFLAIKKKRNGKSNLAGFGSAKCSNEEAYLFQKRDFQVLDHLNENVFLTPR